MLRRRKESDLFSPNVAVYTFYVRFATSYDDDFDDFDMTIKSEYQHLALTQSAGTQNVFGTLKEKPYLLLRNKCIYFCFVLILHLPPLPLSPPIRSAPNQPP